MTPSQKPVRIAKPYNNDTIEASVISVLRSGKLVQGQYVKEFETKLSEYLGCNHVVAVNSGTAALQVGISTVKKFFGTSNGDRVEVITTPFSFAATANAVIGSGCVPAFADIDEETFNIDPDKVKEKIGPNTLAIEPVDVYGLPSDIDQIRKAVGARKIAIIEDAAEAIGARYGGKRIGNLSEISCFSTYATKNLHTCEGGFITTNDDEFADEMRLIRNQGQASRYNQVALGFNYRMQEINAVIGLEQLQLLDTLNEKRMSNSLILKEALGKIDSLMFQRVDNPKDNAWYLFSLILDEKRAGIPRDRLVQRLKDHGIEADVAWPTPIHLQPYYRQKFGYKEGDFPVAERICKKVFQLPIQPFLSMEELQRIIDTMKSMLG